MRTIPSAPPRTAGSLGLALLVATLPMLSCVHPGTTRQEWNQLMASQPPDVQVTTPHHEFPEDRAVRLALEEVTPSVQACCDPGFPHEIVVTLIVEPSGVVREAFGMSMVDSEQESACAEEKMKGVHLRLAQEPAEVQLNLRVRCGPATAPPYRSHEGLPVDNVRPAPR